MKYKYACWIGLLMIMFCLHLNAQINIERVEPPNWWVDMYHNEVELLIYGDQVADLEVDLDSYDHVSLKEVKRYNSKNYLFLTLVVGDKAAPGDLTFSFKNGKGETLKTSYSLLKREGDKKNIDGFDASDAIYLITPDRFVNGDPKNDHIQGLKERPDRKFKGGRHGGDIKGIIHSLDYIDNLGFTAVWVNPVLENDMPEYSYHGYSTTDFYKVDPRFGSNEEFKLLCTKAKEKNLKIIMDMIVNHCGLEHWWMKDLPSEDWINQWPEYTGTNHRKTVVLDPYASQLDYKQFFDGWFVPSMPDLNQRNASMARYLIQNTLWWIEYSGISGIRMDTYPYPDMHFMSDWTKAVMTEYPEFNIVGEEWVTRPTIVSYWQKGKENVNGYRSYLKSLMDFPLQNALVTSLNAEKSWTSSWTHVYEELGQDYLYPDPNELVVFPDNHDMSRVFTQVNEDVDLLKMALVYTATIRGIPQIYYGTEILMKNPGTTDHGVIRSDFPGGWKGDKVNAFTGQGLTDDQREVQDFTGKLLNWRRTNETVHHGQLMHFSPQNQRDVYVFCRFDENNKVLVVFNKEEQAVEEGLKQYEELLGTSISGKDILSGTTFKEVSKISIPAKTAMVIELE